MFKFLDTCRKNVDRGRFLFFAIIILTYYKKIDRARDSPISSPFLYCFVISFFEIRLDSIVEIWERGNHKTRAPAVTK